MRVRSQQVAVITYTNAACDEIIRRLDFDPLVSVSTIHSFVWRLIQGFNTDIRQWLQRSLARDISELQEELRRGRPGAGIAIERQRKIDAKQTRLATLPAIRQFIYSPDGDNRDRDSLNHSEVIEMGATFLKEKSLMQELLIGAFPVLLVDESQDTNKLLMESLLVVQATHRNRFALGLFGDTMQRIYADGKIDLGQEVPDDWAKPAKVMNHRCPQRVGRLINKIRSPVDGQVQRFRSDAVDGYVRLFISGSATADKILREAQARKKMADVTTDRLWEQPEQVKTLILEHHMAAKRMGFLEMFEPLNRVDSFQTGLRDGTLPALRVFSEVVLPLIKAKQSAQQFAAAAIVRAWCPMLRKIALQDAGANQLANLRQASAAVDALMTLFSGGAEPRFLDVLQCVAKSKLLEFPEVLDPFVLPQPVAIGHIPDPSESDATEESASDAVVALRNFLNTPFWQIERYSTYVKGTAAFATHQGVKGLEFPRVLMVADDEDARGFMFSYDKLFGAKAKTPADLNNERSGRETSIDRTRRLLYVGCSRTQLSLAVVAHSTNPAKARAHAIDSGWFDDGEIELLG